MKECFYLVLFSILITNFAIMESYQIRTIWILNSDDE